jgi:HD-GYP domain-containing protein (c-di-GMP phosphodiesterase class II)
MRLIPIECARPESVLAKTIYDDNGIVLLQKGVKLTEQIINKILKMNIYSIYINDEYSEVEVEDVIKPELRQKSISVIKEAFSNVERIKKSTEHSSEKIIKNIRRDYLEYINNIVEELIDSILSHNNVLLTLVDTKSMDNYSYQHSVNVAVISLVMGICLNFRKDELIDLCLGALTHDIGKAFVPKEIITKRGDFTAEESKIYKSHTIKGYDYLLEQIHAKESARIVALQHHERIDGLGYPKGITGSKIHPYAKIVSIANAYDSLTSDCPYRRAIPASDALEFIMAHVNTLFDFEYVNIFAKIIIPYPSGTIVKLSNNDIAVVTATPANYPLRPNVRIIKSENNEKIGKNIKLMKELSLVVKSIEYNV